jgi:hypothetical protein
LNGPFGIAISGSDLFVTNADGNSIGKYTTAGATMDASLVSGPALNGAAGLVMFVMNSFNGTVGEHTTAGATVRASLISGLVGSEGIAVSGTDLFVTHAR